MSLVVWAEQNFNPRSREGSDMNHPCHNRKHTISIHAPAKGATMVFLTVLQKHNHFNPRSREGSDRWTHVWGYWFFNFNPRSREGSDHTLFYTLI